MAPSNYDDVPNWEFKAEGYSKGAKVKYEGNVFVADFWAQSEPGKKPKPEEGWALYDEIYSETCSPSTKSSRIIAYLPTWRTSENFPYEASSLYNSITHLVVSFLMFDSASMNKFSEKSENDVDFVLKKVAPATKELNLKLMVALGGASDSAFLNLMHEIGLNSKSPLLESVAQDITKFVLSRDLDGIDLDLECWWDLSPDGGRKRSDGPHPAGTGLRMLAQRLRQLLPGKIISAAVFGTSYYGNNYDAAMVDYLDWIGIMSYDFTGSWNASPVGPHTALRKIRDTKQFEREQQGHWPGGGPDNNPITSTEDSLWYWTNPFYCNWQGLGANIPRDKIALGVPLYGYDFAYAKDPDDMSGQIPPGYKTLRYKDILQMFPEDGRDGHILIAGSTPRPSFVGQSGMYQFRHNIYFETAESAAEKMAFAQRVGCTGVIVWELTNDVDNSKSIIKRLASTAGREKETKCHYSLDEF